MIDEFNTFRFLPAFVMPIISDGFQTMNEIADAVSSIPYEHPVVIPQWPAQENIYFDTLPGQSHRLAAYKTQLPPGSFATDTFFNQVSSPSAVIARRRGSVLEHAILLCSLFCGKGIDAYVAIGEGTKIYLFSLRKRLCMGYYFDTARFTSRILYRQSEFYLL
jgi:hypothetical protein